MRIQVVTINHGTTDYADLFLRSLIAHHPDRSELRVLVLDNDSGDVQRLDWARRFGVRIRASGYSLDASVNTHGEILRDAVLAEPDCDAYLFADSDVCFVSDDTLGAMARELDSTPDAFAVEAIWANEDDTGSTSTTATAFIRSVCWYATIRRSARRSNCWACRPR
ncbi:glycosyltransferase family 2 protein [Actinopolymorpha singaporensis]|uniref:Glycosyl transferase family 2 n=1 Tax=Actinopolymorpha singaporensis TaxID=117157 RepID=A0A1H1RNF3_9ACTN|nr:hypothetical protein [Actinopolymorpha singaporensis]SDS37301.1 hypothetical protein SAMN04489717_2486 [Actinopolymorpha singaporensis]